MSITIKTSGGSVLYVAETAADVRTALVAAVKQGADLQDADLQGADLQGADLQGADLQGAYLRGAYLQDADLRDADLRDADLQDANLRDANLQDANLRRANLRRANLRDANLRDADLRDADLQDANLQDANLQDANLRGADLRDADLRRADLRDADLRRANLRGADLRDADLQDADLRGANLQDANLRGADDNPRHPLFHVRRDVWSVLDITPAEVPVLREKLVAGEVNGSCYEGSCACLVGTIANVRGVAFDAVEEMGGLRPDSSRPAEQWFMPIRPGDVPVDEPEREGQYRAAAAVRWIDEWRTSRVALVKALTDS